MRHVCPGDIVQTTTPSWESTNGNVFDVGLVLAVEKDILDFIHEKTGKPDKVFLGWQVLMLVNDTLTNVKLEPQDEGKSWLNVSR
jgi:hypothetical protein